LYSSLFVTQFDNSLVKNLCIQRFYRSLRKRLTNRRPSAYFLVEKAAWTEMQNAKLSSLERYQSGIRS